MQKRTKIAFHLLAFFIIAPRICKSLEHQFFIVIPTYNNAGRCIPNLESVIMQENKNWITYIVDDVSSDGTASLIQNYIDQNHLHDKVVLLQNTVRQGALANLYNTIHQYCPDEAIIIFLDGDDRLRHPHVLDRVLPEYQRGAWMTYGQFICMPRGEPGFCREFPRDVLEKRNFRNFKWVSSHLRTCKGWLFKQIKLQDLLQDDGAFYKVAWDRALMLPLLEMAGPQHIRFIPEVLYEYVHHSNNDHVHSYNVGVALAKQIHQKQKYAALSHPQYLRKDDQKADLIIFSYDRPLQLYALLESIQKYMTGLESITVIAKASTRAFKQAYEEIHQLFPHAAFMYQKNELNKADFKPLVMQVLETARTSYILFAVDDIVVKDNVDIADCIRALEHTQAYGFYLRMGENINYCYPEKRNQPCPIRIVLPQGWEVWQFKNGIGDWGYPHTVDMTLYRKKDILTTLKSIPYNSPNRLEAQWSAHKPLSTIGLCYTLSKIVNIPLNKVQTDFNNRNMQAYLPEELLEKWKQNLKLDIRPLYQIANKGPHEEYYLPFIARL